MTKYLLLIVLVGVVWWRWRNAHASRSSDQAQQAQNKAEDMVKCSHCGVNQPVSDSILVAEHYYCCAAHRRAAESETP